MGFDVGTGLLINAGSNLAVGAMNTWQQHKNLQYQKHLQNRIFSREDTSVQRRVADLKAAGLSRNSCTLVQLTQTTQHHFLTPK